MNEAETVVHDYAYATSKQIIAAMLTENTGSTLCDSGGAYGRHWSRKQGRDFDSEPSVTCEWSVYRSAGQPTGQIEPDTTVSLYHWMVHNLSFDRDMQESLDRLYAENENLGNLELAELFAEQEHAQFEHENEPHAVNTCTKAPANCRLSQGLQYHLIYTEDKYEPSHVVLSVHGGCDGRGGYSVPKCFSLRCELSEFMDSMRVGALYAGSDGWDYSDGCWRDCEARRDNVCDAPDPCDLPCVELEWAEALYPELEARSLALQKAMASKEHLSGTQLTPEQIKAAEALMDASCAEWEEELKEAAIEALAEVYGHFTYIKDSQAHLVRVGASGEVISSDPLQAYSNYL